MPELDFKIVQELLGRKVVGVRASSIQVATPSLASFKTSISFVSVRCDNRPNEIFMKPRVLH